jgi:GTP1/Obg family GTP-binding protein
MTRKQLILFFADYRKTKGFTVERDKNRILVEVNQQFMPEDMKAISSKTKRQIQTVALDGICYLLIYF